MKYLLSTILFLSATSVQAMDGGELEALNYGLKLHQKEFSKSPIVKIAEVKGKSGPKAKLKKYSVKIVRHNSATQEKTKSYSLECSAGLCREAI
jgi:hypothetical protein